MQGVMSLGIRLEWISYTLKEKGRGRGRGRKCPEIIVNSGAIWHMAPLSRCLASSHLPVLVVSNGAAVVLYSKCGGSGE